MKKLLFGLLLTVGVSGFSFGNTIIEKSEIVKDEEIISSGPCYHQTVTTYKDPCGNTLGTSSSPLVIVPCGDSGENTVFQTPVTVVVKQRCITTEA